MIKEFQLLNPSALIFIWIPFAAAAAAIFAMLTSRQILEKVAGQSGEFLHALSKRRLQLVIIVSLAMILIVFAAARPSWGRTETTVMRKGRDVVFVIDVSRSMLAEDLYPNRLARAKLAVIDALSVIEGDRVGLVAFAGSAVVKCPLTIDYSFFKQSVELLTPDAVSVGGSMIGDALRKSLNDVLSGGSGGYKDVILITDGEDQESYPLKAAEMLAEREIRLIAIGLGDEDSGRRIPVSDEYGNTVFLTYQGREVWSKLDAKTLREMAALTPGGRYLNVSTGAFDMGEIYSSLIKSQESRFIEEETSVEYSENFQYFLLPAVILIFIYLLMRWVFYSGRRRGG